MLMLFRSFVRDESGEDLIEYGILVSFVAGVVLLSLISDPLGIRPSLVAAFQKANDALQRLIQ